MPRLPFVPDHPTPVTLPAAARHSGRFEALEERVYHLRKFEELRRFTLRTMLSLPPLIIGLWLWDWVIDPRGAPHTLLLRFGMAACLLPCIIAIRLRRVGLAAFTMLVYACVVATEVFWLAILTRLDGGFVYGVGGYMYYVLGMLVISLPLRFWDTVAGLSFALLVPDLAAVAGLLPGFPYAKYNVLLLPAGGLSLFTLWAFDKVYRRGFTYQRSVERLAGEDALTGLANRRHFLVAGAGVLEGVRRYRRAAALLVLDLDHFKGINDRYGHPAGDAVLQAAAELLGRHRRAADLAARIGGEEFAMLLPETDLPGPVVFADRLRAGLQDLRVPVPSTPSAEVSVTMSVGVAGFTPGDASVDAVLRRADAALYRAKHGGRNRVERA